MIHVFEILFIIFVILILVKLIRSHVKSAEKLIKHLESKGDFSTLYELGFYNRNYQRETRRVMGKFDILMNKYNETKDYSFVEYADISSRNEKVYIALVILIFIDLIAFFNT